MSDSYGPDRNPAEQPGEPAQRQWAPPARPVPDPTRPVYPGPTVPTLAPSVRPGTPPPSGPVPPPTSGPVFGAPVPRPSAPSKGPGWVGLIAAMAVTALVSVGATVAITDATGAVNQSTTTESTTPPVTSTSSGNPDWEAVAAAVRPAVVTIQSEGGGEAGTGSGVIIDQDGNIITNHHVVSNVLEGGTLTVSLNDGRLYSATVVGVDQTTDLAVIRLDNPPDNLTTARLSTSDDLQVGQPVMAVGSPLGLSDTVTTGVISALDRPVVVAGEQKNSSPENPFGFPLPGEETQQTEAVVTNAIQIDASINPGNSGGPLFDETGSVIGINSSIASMASGSSEAGSIGLGFAIPVDLVKLIADQIIQTGQAQHSMLGVQIGTGSAEVNGETRMGAVVAEVQPGTAAAEAGLQVGDVILQIGDHPVVSGPSLTGFVRRFSVGDTVQLQVARDGQLIEVGVTLQAKS